MSVAIGRQEGISHKEVQKMLSYMERIAAALEGRLDRIEKVLDERDDKIKKAAEVTSRLMEYEG